MYPLISIPKMYVAQILSNEPSKNINNMIKADVGRLSDSCCSRILFKICLSDVLSNFAILKAELILYVENIQTMNENVFTVYILNSNWNEYTVTWATQPTINYSIDGASVNIQKITQCVIDVTSLVRKCYDNKLPNNGIILKNNETQNNTMVTIITDMNSSWRPILKISYSLDTSGCAMKFIEYKEIIDTDGNYKFSEIKNLSLNKTNTFFIKNIGNKEIGAKLQVSPDGDETTFVDSCAEIKIKGNETVGLVSEIFGKFIRVAVKNIESFETSQSVIWYQAQE